MGPLRFLLALAAATAAWAVGLRLWPAFPQWVDPFLVLVVYVSLTASPAWSVAGGTTAGLATDTLAGGSWGLFGFADTLTAYVCARLQERLLLREPLRLGWLFALAAALQQAVAALLRTLLVPGASLPAPAPVLGKIVTTTLLGVALVALGGGLQHRLDRWRDARRRRLSIDTR